MLKLLLRRPCLRSSSSSASDDDHASSSDDDLPYGRIPSAIVVKAAGGWRRYLITIPADVINIRATYIINAGAESARTCRRLGTTDERDSQLDPL